MPDELVIPKGIPKDIFETIMQVAPNLDASVQTFFRIKNKKGEIVRFKYNRPQRLASERSQRFNFVLKARKMGISSRRIARAIWKCATTKYQHRVLLTQSQDATDVMMAERVKPLIENCLYPLGAVFRENYVFFPLTESRYYVGTAGSKKFGRSKDITGYDLTEFCHWEDPDVLVGVEEACVDGADGDIETTANGHNFGKLLWEKAKSGQTRYRAIFLPWYTDEDYELPNADLGIMSEAEHRLVEAFRLTKEQLAWRRHKISEMSDPGLFPQEYPSTDDEAFLTSGRLVFDWVALLRHRNMCTEPKFTGTIRDKGDRLDFDPTTNGKLKVWKVPEPGNVYAIGADVAEGLEGGAYSAGEVIDLGDSEQVAEWWGHIDPTLFADELTQLGQWYNWAHLIPESWPGPGAVTTKRLQDLDYPKLWRHIDSDRHGFETTSKSKPLMIAELNSALRDLRVTIRSKELLAELKGYVYKENGEMVPSVGAFSDRLMAFAIAWQATRDIASRVDYYRPERPDFRKQLGNGPMTSIPKWSGPMQGRRLT